MSETSPNIETREAQSRQLNILDNFDVVFQAISDVEKVITGGHDCYLEESGRLYGRVMSAAEDFRYWKLTTSPEELERLKRREMMGFMGMGGINRYIILGDGSIILSAMHSSSETLRKAKELGIDKTEY